MEGHSLAAFQRVVLKASVGLDRCHRTLLVQRKQVSTSVTLSRERNACEDGDTRQMVRSDLKL